MKKIMAAAAATLMAATVVVSAIIPKANETASAAVIAATDIQSVEDDNFVYLATTYNNNSVAIEVKAKNSGNKEITTAEISFPALAYYIEFSSDYMHRAADGKEVIQYTTTSSYKQGETVTTIRIYPADIENLQYDTSLISIGGIRLESNNSHFYMWRFDINEDGKVSVIDAQTLLLYVLNVQIDNYSGDIEGWNAFIDDQAREQAIEEGVY